MPSVTIAPQTISQPVPAGAGSLVTVTPVVGATAQLEYTKDNAAAVANGTATWTNWPRGNVTSAARDIINDDGWLRLSATAGNCTLDVDPSPRSAGWEPFRCDWAGCIASMGNGQRNITVSTVYTATLFDATIRVDATAGPIIVNLLPAASAYSATTGLGQIISVKKIDATANNVTIDASGAETIDGIATLVISTQWSCVRIQSNGTTWDVISAS